ncbi:MAG: DoxX family protein [Rhizomicrobium sp.]
MSISELISPLLGRLTIAWFFLSEAWWRLHNWEGTIALMQMKHIANAPLFLVLAVLVMIFGSLSLALGYHTRPGALILFGFTVIVSVLIHDYWRIDNALDRSADYDIFIRNLAIAGGLLFLVGMGPGPFALDNPSGKKR